MIKLNTRKWVSQEYVHTITGGDYTLNHNFGEEPDQVFCHMFVGGSWVVLSDYENISTAVYGMQHTDQSTINSTRVVVFRLFYVHDGIPVQIPGNANIRFTCIKF